MSIISLMSNEYLEHYSISNAVLRLRKVGLLLDLQQSCLKISRPYFNSSGYSLCCSSKAPALKRRVSPWQRLPQRRLLVWCIFTSFGIHIYLFELKFLFVFD